MNQPSAIKNKRRRNSFTLSFPRFVQHVTHFLARKQDLEGVDSSLWTQPGTSP